MKINSEILYELINDGTIKENTKLKVYKDDIYITTIKYDGYDFRWNEGTFTSGMFYNPLVDFEIVEESKNIEKLAYKYINTYGNISQCPKSEESLIDKINELIDKVNDLGDKR